MKSIAECVRRIAQHPGELSLRLDLADLLQQHRKPQLARWMREGLAVHSAINPIGSTFPTGSVWGSVRYSSYACPCEPTLLQRLEQFARVCPGYWKTPEHCCFHDYYGRIAVSCWAVNSPSNREQVDELATMTWLEDLRDDGLLEVIEFNLGRPETAEWALELPEAIRKLPFLLNAARAGGGGFTRELSRRLFSWPSLIGLYLTLGSFPPAVAAELPELAPELQFLSLEFERRTRMVDDVIQGLPRFPALRFLALLGPLRPTNRDLAAIVAGPRLATLGLHSRHLTRTDLFALGLSKALRWLGLDSETLTRSDLAEFRAVFPRVQLILSRDMQTRLGPA
ncbi:hypothetical protein [Paludisphaera soli]|uniref:hypothetical protein n=1 Tax=Paludisphaera soli TaxID=2712865 RepID=UPI0013EB987A|nr:hypothetical protein [Paludisphaera soli]